jgi:pimeloyl-ACP methyl ester carboxylesterase
MTETTLVRLPSGIELDTLDLGPRDAPALIFLHGFPESRRAWRHQIAHLSPRFRCVAPDQRGYGASSKPAETEAYALPHLVGDVLALAERLGIARFTLLGHDWGGVVAWAVAAFAPAAVERLVIANAPHPVIYQRLLHLDPAQRAAAQYVTLFRDPAIDPIVARHGLAPILLRAFGEHDGFAGIEPAERADLLARWQHPQAAAAMLNWYRASPAQVPPPEAPLALPDGFADAPFPRIVAPTLVLWGEEDVALTPANLTDLGAHVADLRIARLPGCGHFSPWQAADAANAALDRFLG